MVAGHELLEELGKGGMGVVYKARQVQLGRVVALKMLRSASAGRQDLIRFRIEAEAVARLQHPNIVQVHEIGEHEGQPYFSLEYLEGGSLDQQLAGKPLAPEAAGRLVETLARAIHFAHERGVIHRDLKPANVLLVEASGGREPQASGGRQPPVEPAPPGVTGTGGSRPPLAALTPKITDFGLARRLDDGSRQTQSGVVVGTPSYMAPEQAEGKRDVGPLGDVYSLGAILYECLTGKPPFSAGSVVATLEQVRLSDPLPPGRMRRGVPRDLETICLKCLQKQPENRYPTAAALADDLGRFREGRPLAARPVGWGERTLKWARRRPSAAALLAVTAALAASVAAAVPLHIAHLRSRVAEVTAAMRLKEQQKRAADLRAECEKKLGLARHALTEKDPDAVQQAAEQIGTVQSLLDREEELSGELRELRGEANELRLRARQRLYRLGGERKAQEQARTFLKRRDEAFFHLHREVVTGPELASPRASARAARQALASFPDLDCLDPEARPPLLQARRQVLFVLAEATARSAPEPESLRQALGILDQVDDARMQGVHRRRAAYLDRLGEPALAARERKKAEALPPAGALDWFLRGQERYQRGDAAGALDCFDRALDEQPELFWAQFFRALCLQKQNNAAEAKAALGLCIRARPDFIWPYLLRSFLHGEDARLRPGEAPRHLRAAEADLARADRLLPDPAARYVIHVQRGLLALARQQGRRAVAELQRAVLTLPRGYHAHVNLAQAYWRRGQRERALAALDHAVDLQPELPELYRTRAAMQQKRGDGPSALRDLGRAIALEPGRRPSPALVGDHRERARILSALNRYPEALAACGEALALAPDDPGALRLRAEALLELGRYREALAAFDRFLAKGSNTSTSQVEAYLGRAKARLGAGDPAGVLEDYTLALAVRRDPSVLAARGWVYLATGSSRAAQRDFDEAVKRRPNSSDALAGRALARVGSGEVKAALADAEEALRRGPRSSRLLYHVARAYACAGPAYRTRALALLRDAVLHLPPHKRGGFWRDQVRRDGAFRPLASLPGFERLDRQFSERRTASSTPPPAPGAGSDR
jgi:tetratricopeptide (TPR) repeat protein